MSASDLVWRCWYSLLLAMAGAAVGLLFPKFEATALLQFPEAQKAAERSNDSKLPEQRSLDPEGQRDRTGGLQARRRIV